MSFNLNPFAWSQSTSSRRRRPITAGLTLLLSALLFSSTACVEDVGTINRTEPYQLKKESFEGVWLYMQTTTDVPYSSAVSFVGEQPFLGGPPKVIFDIQEKWLIAYPTVETIEGTEKDWKQRSIRKYWEPGHRDEFVEMYVGPPVARWPIEKHFDLQRDYNTYNGAQSNAMVENTQDRPWYERDYIRVQWHRQGIQDFFFSLKSGEGNSYFVGEEKPWDPDEFYQDPDGGYFDFVIRTVTWSLGQNRCSIYELSAYDCAQTEVKVRHAFKRFDPRRDYEPLRYHNEEHQERFGFFATERYAYDSDWGSTYRGAVQLINRWNLWDKNYRFNKPTDENGEELTIDCFQDKDCDSDAGERCQKEESWFETGYCATPEPLPYSERGLRPIIFHLSAEWHPDYLPSAYQAADSWTDVFKDSVAWLLMYEEKGQARPKACESNADCANADLLFDATRSITSNRSSCYDDTQCASGICGGNGFCAEAISCNANTPCAVGQQCEGGFCTLDGEVQTRVQTTTGSASLSYSVIYAGPDRTAVLRDDISSALRGSMTGQSFVRFVNLDKDGRDLGLTVNGQDLTGGVYDAARDLHPDNPAYMGSFSNVFAPAGGAPIQVTSAGEVLAESSANLNSNSLVTIIYNGRDLIAVTTPISQLTGGVRLIHAASNAGALDLGLQGVKRVNALNYMEASRYERSTGSQQRATVSPSGSFGTFTCLQADTINYCSGWGADLTDADRQRVATIKSELPDMFVLCENQYDAIAASDSVDPAERETFYGDARYTRADGYNPCGDSSRVPHPEELKKVGDARYSFFYWVNASQRSGPLGYGPSLADPDTGEILIANANVYGGAMLTYAQYAKDLIDLVNDDIGLEEMASGDWIRAYLNAQDAANAETGSIYGALSAGDKTFLDLDDPKLQELRIEQPDLYRARMRGLKSPVRVNVGLEIPELLQLQANPKKMHQALVSSVPKVDPAFFHNRLNKVNGTWLEDMMINDEILLASKYIEESEDNLSASDIRRKLSPTSWSSKYALQKESARLELLGKNNLFMPDFLDDTLYGLARNFKQSGLSSEEIKIEFANMIMRGVLEHEVGHTVGLRHNFSGSTDVFNFQDEYYAIREREPILCRDDSWCDSLTGESCAISSCTADSDCPTGTLCSANRCSAPNSAGTSLVPTGACSLPLEGNIACANNRACGEDGVCHEGRCYVINEQMIPRSWQTDSEMANRRGEYQYSTIMDYQARLNGDIHGLGKYDYAAIRFGYAQLVDVYTDTSVLDRRIQRASGGSGSQAVSYSSFRNAREFWPTRGTGFYHPFMYLNNYIGVEQNLLRTPRPYHEVKNQRALSYNDSREYIDIQYVEVPYAYCSDEYRGNMGCYYFDSGIDMGEMSKGAADMLENYYIFDAFKRERLFYGSYGNPMAYYSRIMDRYLRVMGDVGMYYALYDNLLFRYSFYQEWKESPLGGRTMETASLDTFNKLKNIISAPAPGSYKYDARKDAYVNISFDQDVAGSDFSVPFGEGRFPYTQFGDELGYYYYEHPLWFGSFWEKLGAIVTLTDSTAYFVDTYVGEQIDVGVGTSLGFNTVFADDLNNFLGGIISGDLSLYAGREVEGVYLPPSESRGNLNATPVVPGLDNFTIKLYAAIYGLAFMPAGFDPQFIDRLAVFLEGEAVQFAVSGAANLTEVRFEDPFGSKVYVAYTTNYGTTDGQKTDVGAELVQRAQDLASDWAVETDTLAKAQLEKEILETREVLDVLRQLNQVYGTSTLGF